MQWILTYSENSAYKIEKKTWFFYSKAHFIMKGLKKGLSWPAIENKTMMERLIHASVSIPLLLTLLNALIPTASGLNTGEFNIRVIPDYSYFHSLLIQSAIDSWRAPSPFARNIMYSYVTTGKWKWNPWVNPSNFFLFFMFQYFKFLFSMRTKTCAPMVVHKLVKINVLPYS